jgi:hypothetical protein
MCTDCGVICYEVFESEIIRKDDIKNQEMTHSFVYM